jgi:hypothetical protein
MKKELKRPNCFLSSYGHFLGVVKRKGKWIVDGSIHNYIEREGANFPLSFLHKTIEKPVHCFWSYVPL